MRHCPTSILAAFLALALVPAATPAGAGETVDCVLVQVNQEILTLSDFMAQKKAVLDEIYRQKLPDAETQKRIDEARRSLLPSMIEDKLLVQKAKNLGLSVTSDELDRIINSIMEQNKLTDQGALDKALRSEGITVAKLRTNIERRSLVEKVKQFEVASKVVVTDDEISAYYAEHKADFREPERIRLREIVLVQEKRDPVQVRKEIEEIGALVRNGADFAELATLFSQAPTAEHGGDLGLVRTEELSADIRDTAVTLEIGQVSAPIKTAFGFHLLKLIERKQTSYRTLEQARDDIVVKIQESRYGDRLKTYLEDLKSGSYVQIDEACNAKAI